jgi:hypothetical protein
LMEIDDNILLIGGNLQGILKQQFRPCPINFGVSTKIQFNYLTHTFCIISFY